MILHVKEIIQGRYRIEKIVGRGGMGEIFLAWDMKEETTKAIKRIFSKDSIGRHRFRREYKLLSRVEHPSIVKAYELFEQEQDLFMVMEFVQGESLRSILKNRKRIFSLTEQLAIASKVARGLEVIHRSGTIHRDIKPDNIMIDIQRGEVKLIDLGLAKSFEQSMSLTQAGDTLGTAAYMSPEQADQKDAGVESDIFSLGTTLYQFFLWESESPFDADTWINIMFQLANHNPPNLYEKTVEMYRKLRTVLAEKESQIYKRLSIAIHKAIEKNPEKRWKSSVPLAEELETIYEQSRSISDSISYPNLSTLSPKPDQKLYDTLEALRMENEEHGEKKSKARKAAKKVRQEKKGYPRVGMWGIVLSLLLGIAFVFWYTEVGSKNSVNIGDRQVDEKRTEEKRRYGLPDKIWNECRYLHKGEWILDMTHDRWAGLPVSDQLKHAEEYQKGYAREKGLAVEKTVTEKGASFVFRLIPPGRFYMGSNDAIVQEVKNIWAENKWGNYDETRHPVVIGKSFYLGKTEVTQEQWKAVTGETPWVDEKNKQNDARHPATHVSWRDVKQKFFPRLAHGFTLPTEAQWEYACRCGTRARFYWGDDESETEKYAWYTKNTPSCPQKVAEKIPNAFGLYDTIGNVQEWCEDGYGSYLAHEQVDPVGPQNNGRSRVHRGGAWNRAASRCRASHRFINDLDHRHGIIGFRCVLQE